MKRLCFIVLAALMTALAAPKLAAQSANDLFNQFMSLSQCDKNNAYSALYRAYEANLKQLKGGSADARAQAKSNLLQMWPYLENAAIFYSSKNISNNATFMAQAYIEMPLMEEFRGVDFDYSSNRAQLAYYVGSRYFNNKNYEKSIPFLNEYLKTGDEQNRRNVFACMIKACSEAGQQQLARTVLDEAARNYPNDWNIISTGVNLCSEMKDYDGLQQYLTKAKALRPNDKAVNNIQAKLYEDTNNFAEALNMYLNMLRSNPNSLEINKHVALNYFNLAALNSNKALTETNSRQQSQLFKAAQDNFAQAIPYLEKIIVAEPQSKKYNTALAVAYAQTGKKDKLANQNRTLASMGAGSVSEDMIPQMISFAGGTTASFDAMAQNQGARPQQSQPGSQYQAAPQPAVSTPAARPKFSEFARGMIEESIAKWQAKDPYETADEYRQRVTEAARNQKVAELQKQAEEEYIRKYASTLSIRDFALRPYDAENGVFLIEGAYGQLVLPVPRSNNEARVFEQNWNGIALRDPKFFIADDDLAIAEVNFMTPTGKSYAYSNAAALTYTQTKVDVKFDDIDYSGLAQNSGRTNNVNVKTQEVTVGTADVDMNIPVAKKQNPLTFALIIANENYSMVSKVPSALNDGKVFAEYCQKTLGLPKQNILQYGDASYGVMLTGMNQLKEIAEAYKNDEFNVIFYYAGHGIPNEATKDGYLLPTDSNGKQMEVCYSLNKLYDELGALGAKSVVVFLDACFSGAQREGGMLASARGIALKAKGGAPKGNMVVFSAATGDETAYPYTDKGHGLFTYYLLKKLQETEGNVSLQQLGDYITDNVRKQSVLINHKSQTPTVTAAPGVSDAWRKWQLNK